jgi:hypothetical protein
MKQGIKHISVRDNRNNIARGHFWKVAENGRIERQGRLGGNCSTAPSVAVIEGILKYLLKLYLMT